MSDTQIAVLDPPQASLSDDLAEYIVSQSVERGSRTDPHKTMAIMLLSREGRSQTAIASILGMDARTVKAILSRQDSIIADGRMLLKANTLGFVGDAIKASEEAAKRGKLEGISAMLDRLGVTEPPKSQQQTNVAVQVNLHGGPEPVSLAKVIETSEGPQEQAQLLDSPITQVMYAKDSPQVQENIATCEPQVNITTSVSVEPQPAPKRTRGRR